jgi:hypothetical protein
MEITKNDVEVLIFALTLKDRENKNKKNKEKWLSKGFKKIKKQKLLDYWFNRINTSAKDFTLYKEVRLSYEKTSYNNLLNKGGKLKINIEGVAPEKLPRLLFKNLIAAEAEKEYKKLTYSVLTIFSSLLDVPVDSLEALNLDLRIKDKSVLEFLEARVENKIDENIRPAIDKAANKNQNATNGELPSVWSMLKNVGKAAVNSAKSGFKLVTDEQYDERTNICKSCEFWNPKAFNNTGQCVKCGCSTKAKLKLATEKCPIGKWLPTV